jgi:large subunit ribosomal protein L29
LIMKIVSLRDMTKDELLQKLHELKADLFGLRMRKTLKELDNPLRLRTIRRDIARIQTILTEDRKNIRMIVDTPISILDRRREGESRDNSEAASETEKSE